MNFVELTDRLAQLKLRKKLIYFKYYIFEHFDLIFFSIFISKRLNNYKKL